jgi:hypothetical protein
VFVQALPRTIGFQTNASDELYLGLHRAIAVGNSRAVTTLLHTPEGRAHINSPILWHLTASDGIEDKDLDMEKYGYCTPAVFAVRKSLGSIVFLLLQFKSALTGAYAATIGYDVSFNLFLFERLCIFSSSFYDVLFFLL